MRFEIVAYKLQVISSVFTDVLYDVTVGHPFGDHREPPVIEGVRDADKTEDIGMRQVLPRGDFFTEMLHVCEQTQMRRCSLVSDLADFRFVVLFRDSQGLYGNVLPFEHSRSNVSKAAGSVRQPREVELVG